MSHVSERIVIKMTVFIKTNSLKKKLVFLYLLNVTDILFTLVLLRTGYFTEANSLMANAVQNPTIGFFLKLILPAVLLCYLNFRMKKATEKQRKTSNFLLNIVLFFYVLVNVSHVVWIAILPILSTL